MINTPLPVEIKPGDLFTLRNRIWILVLRVDSITGPQGPWEMTWEIKGRFISSDFRKTDLLSFFYYHPIMFKKVSR